MNNQKLVTIGRLGSVYGVRGWQKLQSFTDPKEKIFDYPNWQIQHRNEWIHLTLEAHKPHGDGLVVKFAEIKDREQARLYTNNEIAIYRDQLPEITEEEFYCHDLIGLEVFNHEGKLLGKVIDLHETGANDVFIIQGKKRHLVPYLDSVVKSIDLKLQKMIVEWDDEF